MEENQYFDEGGADAWTDNGFQDKLRAAGEEHIKYLIMGREVCPGSKRLHWQGYVEFDKTVRMAGVKKIFGTDKVHLEKRMGTRQEARDYCLKTAKEDEIFEIGEFGKGGQGKRTDIEDLKTAIKEGKSTLELFDEQPAMWRVTRSAGMYKHLVELKQEREKGYIKKDVQVYWGPTGCGKTRKAFEENPGAYMLNQSPTGCWWDGYDGEECVIIDEFRGWIPFAQLLRITDGYPCAVPIKGGTVTLRAKKIVITSNLPPHEWYPGVQCLEDGGIDKLLRRVSILNRMETVKIDTV